MTAFRDAFVEHVKRLHQAERQLLSVLPVFARLATDPALNELLLLEILETDTRAERIERILRLLGEEPECVHSPAMAGIIVEGLQLVSRADLNPLRDAQIIATVRQARYHGMAAYGTAVVSAVALELPDIGDLLHQALIEEHNAEAAFSAANGLRAQDDRPFDAWSFDVGDQLLSHRTRH